MKYDLEIEDSSGTDGITMETFGVADMCLSPPVPTALKPYLPDSNVSSLDWLQQGAYISYGYRWVVLPSLGW